MNMPADQIEQCTVLNLDALRSSSRTRCEHDIRQILRRGRFGLNLPHALRSSIINIEPIDPFRLCKLATAMISDADLDSGVFQHEVESFDGVCRIERNVSSTSHHHSKASYYERRRPMQ